MTILRLFRDGSRLEFGKGHLDRWAVYLVHPIQGKALLQQQDTLERLERLAHVYSPRMLYEDFVVIYNRTTHEPQNVLFDLIHTLARVYVERNFEVEVTLALLYMLMVALERQHRSQLGIKRYLRLPVHELLIEGYSPHNASMLSKDRLDQLADACTARGF